MWTNQYNIDFCHKEVHTLDKVTVLSTACEAFPGCLYLAQAQICFHSKVQP